MGDQALAGLGLGQAGQGAVSFDEAGEVGLGEEVGDLGFLDALGAGGLGRG